MSSKREVYYSYVPLLCSFGSLSYKHAFDHIRWFEWWDQVRDILRLGPQFEHWYHMWTRVSDALLMSSMFISPSYRE